MSAAAGRMANLIQDLLNLSRVSRAELAKQPVDMSEIARSVTTDLESHSPGRSVETSIQDRLATSTPTPRPAARRARQPARERLEVSPARRSIRAIEFGSTQAAGKTGLLRA